MPVKFITINIWEGGRLLDELIDFLEHEQPDIITMQEVYNSPDTSHEQRLQSLPRLQAALDLPYASFAPTFKDVLLPAPLDRGNAVLSRFPIESTKTIFFDVPYDAAYKNNGPDYSYTPRNMQHVAITAPNYTINAYNVHGIWGFDGQDTERRLEMADLILAATDSHEHVVVAGDFNVHERTETIRRLETKLQNVFKDERTTSFNMQRKTNPGYATAIVDFVFVSHDLTALTHTQPTVDVSDHLPLVCELERVPG